LAFQWKEQVERLFTIFPVLAGERQMLARVRRSPTFSGNAIISTLRHFSFRLR
jgi:hypothetical protein